MLLIKKSYFEEPTCLLLVAAWFFWLWTDYCRLVCGRYVGTSAIG